MFQGARGMEFMRRLVKALGYEGRAVERVVIDIRVGSIVKVHVVEHAHQNHCDAFLAEFDAIKAADLVEVERVQGVEVLPNADAVVVATPLSEKQVEAVREQLGAMMDASVPMAVPVQAMRPMRSVRSDGEVWDGAPGTPVGDGCGTLQVNGVNVSGLCLGVWKHKEGEPLFWEAAPTDPLPAEAVGRSDMHALMGGRLYPVRVLTMNRVRSSGPPVKALG